MKTLINTMMECRDPQVSKLCMYVMVSSINFEKGGLCFQGSAQALAEEATRYPFGVIDWEILSIFAIWSDRMDKILEVDRSGMCKHVERLINNRAHWDDEIKTHFCWLYKNIKCHEFDKINMDELLRTPKVIDFLKMTEQVESDL
jgi:hypothetical protein